MSQIEQQPLLSSTASDAPPRAYDEFSKQQPQPQAINMHSDGVNLESNPIGSKGRPNRYLFTIGIFLCLICCFSPLIAYGGWNLMLSVNSYQAEHYYGLSGVQLAGSIAMGCFILSACCLSCLISVGFVDGATDDSKNELTFKVTSALIAISIAIAIVCLFTGIVNGILLVSSADKVSTMRTVLASLPFTLGVFFCVGAANLTQYGRQIEPNAVSLKLNVALCFGTPVVALGSAFALMHAAKATDDSDASLIAAVLFSLTAVVVCAMSAAKCYVVHKTDQSSMFITSLMCGTTTLMGSLLLIVCITWASFDYVTVMAPMSMCAIGCLVSGMMALRV